MVSALISAFGPVPLDVCGLAGVRGPDGPCCLWPPGWVLGGGGGWVLGGGCLNGGGLGPCVAALTASALDAAPRSRHTTSSARNAKLNLLPFTARSSLAQIPESAGPGDFIRSPIQPPPAVFPLVVPKTGGVKAWTTVQPCEFAS